MQPSLFSPADTRDPVLAAWAKELTAKFRAESQMIYEQMANEFDRKVLTKLWARKLRNAVRGRD